MANWRGTARSNHFRVKDEFAFRAWAGTLGLDVVESPGSPGLFSVFLGKSSEDGDWPSSRLREAGDDFDRDEEESLLRKLMAICSMAIARAANQGESALDVLGAAESQLMEVTEKGLTHGFQSLHQIVEHSFGSIDNLYKQSREVTGLATSFTEFDRMTSGLQKGELIIIAARPSMGKTALAINIAQNAAIKSGAKVAVFSLEMSKESLLRRMLATQAWVDQRKLQTGFLGREDHDKLPAKG